MVACMILDSANDRLMWKSHVADVDDEASDLQMKQHNYFYSTSCN